MYANPQRIHPVFSAHYNIGRFPLSFQVFPALVLACGIMFLPESPRWLMEKDRVEEAKTNLRRLHYNGQNDEFLNLEFSEISQSIAADRQLKSYTFKQILTNPSWRRRLMLGCGIQAFGQLSGINGKRLDSQSVVLIQQSNV